MMLKKLSAFLIILIILSLSSISVFAGNPGGGGIGNDSNAAKNSSTEAVEPDDKKGPGSGSTASPLDQATGDTDEKETVDKDTEAGTIEQGNVHKDENDKNAEFYKAIKEVLGKGEAVDNGQDMVEIVKPESEVLEKGLSIYYKTFLISISSEYSDVIVQFARLNNDIGEYEIIELPDGDRSILLSCGTFSTDMELVEGTNDLLMISYRTSEMEASKVQYNSIKIEKQKEPFWSRIFRTFIGK